MPARRSPPYFRGPECRVLCGVVADERGELPVDVVRIDLREMARDGGRPARQNVGRHMEAASRRPLRIERAERRAVVD